MTEYLIYKKMSLVMKDIGPVTKAQTNLHQKYKFRGIDQFVNALHPALVRHGVIMTTEVLDRTETLKDVTRSNGNPGVDKHVTVKVKYTFYAEDGSIVSSTMVGEGLDSGDKATNKALSSALKYALIQTFSVPTEDMAEADLDSPEIGRVKDRITTELFTQPNLIVGTEAPKPLDLSETPKTSFRKPRAKKADAAKPTNGNGTNASEEEFFSE